MDAYLLSIIQAAEAQRPVPPLRLVLSSGDLVSGVPVRSLEFDVAMEFALASDFGGDQIRSEAALAVLEDSPDQIDALTLSPAEILHATGHGLHGPALRVQVESVTAWWVTGATEVKKGGSWSFGFGIGVFVPIDM